MYNLSNDKGRKWLTGIDSNGNEWKQFELEYYWNDFREVCIDCGKSLEFGWYMTSDKNMTVCDGEMQWEGMNTEGGSLPSLVTLPYPDISRKWWMN